MDTSHLLDWIRANAVLAGAAAAALLAVLAVVVWLARSIRRAGREKTITGLINVAALMATSVQASGMWKFFGNTMGLAVGFRVVLFAFMEIGLLATGLRARANVDEGGDAGVDGILVWVLALASGLMSSTDAGSVREGAMRVLVAVVVALLWTRDLMAAKRDARKAGPGRKASGPVRWRITPERVFVWLRLADAVDTDVSAVDAGRRVARFLRITDRERDGWRWPFTAKARADRERRRMFRDALMRNGDPTAVYDTLAERGYATVLTRLGITDSASQAGESKASQAASLTVPGDKAFEQVIASLPEAGIGTVNGRKRAASVPSQKSRRRGVTARVAIDAEQVTQVYRDSVAAGLPLSSRDLAAATGVSQSTASRVIRAESNG